MERRDSEKHTRQHTKLSKMRKMKLESSPSPKKRLKAITVNLPDDCVDYIKAWREKGVSAGRCVEQLIRADLEVNGLPRDQDDS